MIAPLRSDGAFARHADSVTGSPRPVFFGPAGRRLFGWFHPARGAQRHDVTVVLCPPLGSEYASTGAPRALRHWAERLADSGIATVRFDYHGTGDSAGTDENAGRVRAWIDSVGDAIDFARTAGETRRVVAAGVRFGATLALAAAAERRDVDGLILWAAPPTGKSYLREARAFTRLAATNAAGEPVASALPGTAEQFGGFVFSGETVAALAALDPLGAGGTPPQHVLVVPRDERASDGPLVERLTTAGAQVERMEVAGFDDMMSDAHAAVVPDALIGATIDWLVQRYPPSTGDRGRVTPLPRAGDDGALALPPVADHLAPAVPQRVIEAPVRFGENGRLFGVLSQPSPDRRPTGVLMVNSGAIHHIGPNRLYVTLARRWARLGYTVLRMDVGGIGDSAPPEGQGENHPYPAHAVSDVAAGVAELKRQGVERVVVLGLCSGAHAGFHAGLETAEIDGLMMVNPIVFYWKPTDSLDLAGWLNYNESRHYKQSVREWRNWVRLLSGKIEVSHVARVGFVRAQEIARAKGASISRRLRSRSEEPENAARDLARLAARGDVLLLFSAGDPGHDYLMLRYAREVRRLARSAAFRLCVIDGADHTFTAADTRRRLENLLTEHLLARHR